MSRRDDDAFKQLEQVLTEARRLRPEPVLGPEFVQTVMRDVRRLAVRGADSTTGNAWVERAVWRIAMVTAGLAAVFLVAAVWYEGTERGEPPALVAEEFDEAFGE